MTSPGKGFNEMLYVLGERQDSRGSCNLEPRVVMIMLVCNNSSTLRDSNSMPHWTRSVEEA